MQAETSSNTIIKSAPKILIFDEDPAVRALIVHGLKSLRNSRIYEAGSTSAVEQRVRTQTFDLVVVGRFTPQQIENENTTNIHSDSPEDTTLGTLSTQDIELLALLKESSLCLVLLYQEPQDEKLLGDQLFDSSSHIFTKEEWNHQIKAISQLLGDDPQDGFLLYPRPNRTDLIPALEALAFKIRKDRPATQQMTSTEVALENSQLVLWAGPEDHPLVTELYRACDSMHYHLISVDSAQHALKETRRTRFEVCFVHAELSDMAGLSLVRSLRREVGESLPVAYVGVAQQVSDRLEGVHAGVSLYLNETAGFDAVTQALRHLQNLGTHGMSRVLVIDDEDSIMADAVTAELKRGKFKVSCLNTPLRILELLAEIQTDLLVIHSEMKGLGGFELCRTLRAMPEWQTLPILLLGENNTDELKVAAYRAGADDYLSSSSEEGVIKACIEARLERSRTVQERADRDGLTGLLIRRAFNDALLSQMALARRRGSTVAVCLIDLDHFKSINDTYGHIAGDRVLSALGRLLSSSFRVEDLRGRWGGEEFVVAFSDESAESAKAILERARKEFVRFYFDGEHGERFQAAFSAGVACYPESGETIEDVFKVADRRLYAVKEAGRNNIFAHDPPGTLPTTDESHEVQDITPLITEIDDQDNQTEASISKEKTSVEESDQRIKKESNRRTKTKVDSPSVRDEKMASAEPKQTAKVIESNTPSIVAVPKIQFSAPFSDEDE